MWGKEKGIILVEKVRQETVKGRKVATFRLRKAVEL